MNRKKINKWLRTHTILNDAAKAAVRKNVMELCEWSRDTFYRKMNAPDKLKQYEKHLVAQAYGKKMESFFPEPKKEALPL